MTFSVLVVDAEIEVLGDLASRLRNLGLEVVIADSDRLALERARGRRPDAFVVERRLAEETALLDELAIDRQLASIPCLLMSDAPEAADILDRRDPTTIAKRLYDALPRERAAARDGDFRGDLTQVSVVDLLQLLSMNRRSGALTIATAKGAGEVRLREGEVVDAVFRRQEGEKALFRLLAETEGHFAFASGTETALRRIEVPTSALLLEGMRQLDEVRQLRESIDGAGGFALATQADLPAEASPLEREIFAALETPKSLDDLLEELSESDHTILQATQRLLTDGRLRRIAGGTARPELAEPDRLHLIAALIKRLGREGFGGGARLAFAGEVRRVAALGHASGRMANAEVPADSVPLAPVPHRLATLKFPDGARLELLGLPLADEYAPLWGLSLPGTAAVIQVGSTSSPLLEEMTRALGIPLLETASLLGELDEGDTQQVVALIRSALDHLTAT